MAKQVSDQAKAAAAKRAAEAKKAAEAAKSSVKANDKSSDEAQKSPKAVIRKIRTSEDTQEETVSQEETEDAEAETEETVKPKKKKVVKTITAEEKKSVKGLRIGAIILWVLAVAAEVGAFFALRYVVANNVQSWGEPESLMLIGALVLDAVFCIVAAQLWKKANHISPSLADSKLVRTLWHQLGVIMVLVCFLPIGIILLVKSKELNKKLRTVLLVIFALLFAGATATSVDYNQPSEEEVQQLQEEAKADVGDGEIYWARFGKSYHFDINCQSLSRTTEDNLFSGTLDDAFAANRWDPCDYCAGGAEAKLAGDSE